MVYLFSPSTSLRTYLASEGTDRKGVAKTHYSSWTKHSVFVPTKIDSNAYLGTRPVPFRLSNSDLPTRIDFMGMAPANEWIS